MIVKRNWNNDLVVLKTIKGEIIEIGDVLVSSREGERYRIIGATPPHKPESTGRISVKSLYRYDPDERDWTHEYFPAVLDLEWVSFKPASMIEAVKIEQMECAVKYSKQVHLYLLNRIKGK